MKHNKILILFAHPLYEKSRANKILNQNIPNSDYFTFHDLYECYPNFEVDIAREQELLLAHDIIIWQHPLYWYSCPALLKQWIDMVLVYDWAYGERGILTYSKIKSNKV
uniref:NAD(P)H-dependent oxidoreductase n=1 Tax=Ornithobacterium rhinotracheale TaxID=28251 RepID=UPI0021A9C7EA|nr:NAD(P)H-dependent oxidoreductase [Ornithobacterium rhinotracheale]